MLEKTTILNNLAREKIVEKMINNITKTHDDDLDDLAQDLYIELFEKDEKLLNKLYQSGEINDYIFKMARNNILSKTSPFYYKYKKNKKREVQFDDKKDI